MTARRRSVSALRARLAVAIVSGVVPVVVPGVVPVAVSLIVIASASPAFALCPNCLGQRDRLTPTLELVGIFLLIPFAIAAALIRIVRRTLAERPRGGGAPPRR